MTVIEMITKALQEKHTCLTEREADLAQARKRVMELEDACNGFKEQIWQLEYDKEALARGHIALMGDAQSGVLGLQPQAVKG